MSRCSRRRQNSKGTIKHHTSCILQHASYIIHHTSYIMHHASYTIHHTSYVICHTSCIIRHTSYIIRHTFFIHHTPCAMILHHTSICFLMIHLTSNRDPTVCVCVPLSEAEKQRENQQGRRVEHLFHAFIK